MMIINFHVTDDIQTVYDPDRSGNRDVLFIMIMRVNIFNKDNIV